MGPLLCPNVNAAHPHQHPGDQGAVSADQPLSMRMAVAEATGCAASCSMAVCLRCPCRACIAMVLLLHQPLEYVFR